MYVWEYEVLPGKEPEFVAAYGPRGSWAELFRRNAGYIRTELHRDRGNPRRFVTLDYWESAEHWDRFRRECSTEFEELDSRFEELTVSEREIGRFGRIEDE